MKAEQQYIDLYKQCRGMICEHSSDVMNTERDAAFERFASNGFPAFRCDVPNLSTSLYFVVNDIFYHDEKPKGHLPEGVIIGSLKDFATSEYYNRLAGQANDAVTDLNTMLAQDGLYVYVPKNVKVDRAIQVINILRSDVDLMVNRRVLIVLEERAEIKMLFCDHAADDRNFLATQVIEAYVGENASLDLYCMEETHNKNVRVSNVYIDQQANSRVNHNVITLHNGVTRNKLDLTFSGEGAECQCYGCVIARVPSANATAVSLPTSSSTSTTTR